MPETSPDDVVLSFRRKDISPAIRELFLRLAEWIRSIVISSDGKRALSSSDDNTIRLWDLDDGRCLSVLEGHSDRVLSVAWSHDDRRALSASTDNTIRLWDLDDGRCLRVLEGHSDSVWSVAWSHDDRRALSASYDTTIRLWDLEDGRCLRVLKGHSAPVRSVAWSHDDRRALSAAANGVVRLWDLGDLAAFGPAPEEAQTLYTNAKVLLVGDSGVGKTGLARYLALGLKDEERNSSTDGAWATHWPLPHSLRKDGVSREIWLWDFAGQIDYRLVHQLFLDEASAAVLVFNPQAENPFDGLGQWDRDLQKTAARWPFAKLLAAGRTDRGGLVVSEASLERFMEERGFRAPLHRTSAKSGAGCEELCQAIVDAIDWDRLPVTTSLALYQRMKEEILRLRDGGMVLIRLSELNQRLETLLADRPFTPDELGTALKHLARPGMVQPLDFGGFVLLQPEILSRYAAALVRKVRQHPREMGCILEDDLLAGDLDYQDFRRLPAEEEGILLRALQQTVVSRAWCLRQHSEGKGALLTFPSYFRRERPHAPAHPSVLVTYRFAGLLDEIYATLVVFLHHTTAFESTDLWKDAADFKTRAGAALGFSLFRESEGAGRLEAHFASDVDEGSRILFLTYLERHLRQHDPQTVRLRHYHCGNRRCGSFGSLFLNRREIDNALAPGGLGKVFCGACGKPIPLRDKIESSLAAPESREAARKMQEEGQHEIDNESREIILVGHAFTIAGEAGQIYRGYTNSDHGIDGEIEFKDDAGQASGKRLYLQLKSGDSYLTPRQRDDAEVFKIKNPRWARYWQQQAYPVMLVIRTSDGRIRWMDVSAWLKRNSAEGKTVRQVVFEGERFDAVTLRQWRDRMMGSTPPP